jgi:hypothetical protein
VMGRQVTQAVLEWKGSLWWTVMEYDAPT